MKRKKINLAKALTNNKCCLGFIFRFSNNSWFYQNDNDLGLDLDGIDLLQPYIKKIYIYKRYYVYQMVGGYEPSPNEPKASYKTVIALLKECHKHIIPLTKQEEELCRKYWGY